MHIVIIAHFLVLHLVELSLLEVILQPIVYHVLLPCLKMLAKLPVLVSLEYIFGDPRKGLKTDLELIDLRPELVDELLDLVIKQLAIRLLLVGHLKDGAYLLWVVDIEYWVVDNVLKQLVGHGLDLLFGTLDGSLACL